MEISEMIEVLQRAIYADGKCVNVEIAESRGNNWRKNDFPLWNFAHHNYRIKPEPKRVKLTMQDMVDRIKKNKTLAVDYKTEFMDFKTITNWEYFNEVGIKFIGFYELSPFEDLINMNFADGTPCYKEVEDE